MDKFQEKTAFLQKEMTDALTALIDGFGYDDSNFIKERVIRVEPLNEDLCFTLAPDRWLSEISHTGVLIDNKGYQYGIDVISIHQLAELVDLLTVAVNAEKANEAREAFQQWCDDDAAEEQRNYINETGDYESIDFDTDAFYIWLYDKGIRM